MNKTHETPPSILQFIHSSFEGLDDGRLFFNNAAGALRLKSVLDLQRKLSSLPDYPSAGAGSQAEYLLTAMEAGEESVRFLLDAPEDGHIIQDLSASRLLFSLADAATRMGTGNRIVTTGLDHPAAIDGAKRAATKYSKQVTVVPVDKTIHSVTAEQVIESITPDTALLMLTCTSNTTGAQLPYSEIVHAARQKCPELYVVLDGVQRLPHGPVGLTNVPADALVLAPYKVFSSRGSGLAWISDRLNRAGQDCLLGQNASTWCLGSVDPVSFGLMKAVADYFAEIGHMTVSGENRRELIYAGQKFVESREQALQFLMLEGTDQVPGLRHIPGVHVWFDQDAQSSKDFIVSVTVDGRSSEKIFQKLIDHNIFVSLRKENSIYCGTLLKEYECGDILRISPMHYNTEEEILRFLQVMQALVV